MVALDSGGFQTHNFRPNIHTTATQMGKHGHFRIIFVFVSETIVFARIFLLNQLSLSTFALFAFAVCRSGLHAGLSCTFSMLGKVAKI